MGGFRLLGIRILPWLIAALPVVGFGQGPSQKEPLSEWSKQWLDEVVPYIITDAEKSLFLSLPNEAERGKFIQHFWDKRDPNPQTPENEFKLSYYKRIAQANRLFGTESLSGWKTDRGRIYILLGPPQDIQRVFNAESDFSASSVSKEIWDYWNLPNPRLPYNIEFTFVDAFNTGHFRLQSGLAPSAGGGTALDLDSMSYVFDRMEFAAEAEKNPFEDSRKLQELITTQVTYDLIPIDYEALCFKGPEGRDDSPFTIEIPYASLASKKIDDKNHYSLTLMVSLSNRLGQSLFQRSRQINFNHSPEEMIRLETSTRQIQMELEWEPGDYQLHLLVLDNFSGKIGTSHRNLSLVRYEGSGLAMSDVILSQEKDPSAAEKKASPPGPSRPAARVDRIFESGRNLDVYFEVYDLALNPETGLNRFRVSYVILQGDRILARVPSPEIEPSGQRDSRVVTSLKLKNFQPGAYTLRIGLDDETTKRSISKEIGFRILDAPAK